MKKKNVQWNWASNKFIAKLNPNIFIEIFYSVLHATNLISLFVCNFFLSIYCNCIDLLFLWTGYGYGRCISILISYTVMNKWSDDNDNNNNNFWDQILFIVETIIIMIHRVIFFISENKMYVFFTCKFYSLMTQKHSSVCVFWYMWNTVLFNLQPIDFHSLFFNQSKLMFFQLLCFIFFNSR